jgi:CheY-like chemotaxis protein
MQMPELSILLMGDLERAEFIGAREILESSGKATCFARANAAIEAVESGAVVPDLVVVAQSFPDQISRQTVDRLRRLAPLCRIVALLGSWCEGEIRSGHPWPAAMRIYWHQWELRARRELGRLLEGNCPSWGLPMTATDDERILESAARAPAKRQGLIAIHARVPDMADWLSAACRMRGYSTVWLRQSNCRQIAGARGAIFDALTFDAGEREQLTHLCGALEPTPVVVMLDFPRLEDNRRAFDAGAAAVLSKPLNLEDLYWQLDMVAGGP